MSEPAPATHDEILAGTDLARIHRFTFLVAVAWGFFTLSHILAERYLLAWLHGAACVVSSLGVTIAYSRIPWRERVALPLVAGGSMVALIAIAVMTGGSDAPAMGFVSLVPLVTGLYRRRGERMAWLGISLVGIGLIPILHAWAPTTIDQPVTLAHRVVAALGLAVLLYLWGSEWRASSDRQAALLEARARTIQAQAEEIRVARDEALRASEQKSRFVAMTSHELRGPLNGILGMSHALADTRLGEHQRDLVRALGTSAESLSGLLADLLDIARIEAGRLDVVLAPTEVREVIADVVDAFALDAARKGLDISALSAPEVPLEVDADAGRLAQVLRNLVSNAVKFTDHGSVVVEADVDASTLAIRVVDTGKGMSRDDIGRIFAPFEQVSADLLDRRAGTGLGLWISRNLVERWGGSIEVESALGVGTTFRVNVPIVVPEASERPNSLPPDAGTIVALTRRPLTARAFLSVARELGVDLSVHAAPDPTIPAHVVVADLESLDAAEVDALAQRGLGARLVLAARAGRIPDAERIANGCGARVLLLPVRARRLASALEVGETLRENAIKRLEGRLLVVDDDAINRRVARHAAEQLGLEVSEAATGEEALRIALGTRIDVVLLDLHLEGDDGVRVAARIRDALGADAPALVAYTGTVHERDRRRLADAGMVEILGKPLDRSAFSAAIGRVLHARRRRSRTSILAIAPSTFDPAALAELEKIMGDRSTAIGMLEEFVPELSARVATIGAAVATGDLPRIADESHRLASMAATFGAHKVATIARGLESVSREGSVERVRIVGGELVAAEGETAPLLRAYLATP